MQKHLVSVIIPTLNEEFYIPILLQDLAKQKDKHFEVIIVDGNSADKTCEHAHKFGTILKLKVLNTKKQSISFQRNLGAASAEGSYLIFIDADSRVSPQFISQFRTELKKTNFLIYLPTLIPQGSNPTDLFIFQLTNFLVEMSQSFGKPLPTGSAMIFQRDYFLHLGGYKEKPADSNFFPEDHDIIMRAHDNGVKAKFLKQVKVRFSLRRINKEGRLQVYRKYLISAVQMVTKGKVDKNLFKYEMGGHVYHSQNGLADENQKEFLDQLKSVFKNIV